MVGAGMVGTETCVTEGDLARAGRHRWPTGRNEGSERPIVALTPSESWEERRGPQPCEASERPMRKPPVLGTGQLVLQIAFPNQDASDGTGETEADGLAASGGASTAGSKPERKGKWYSLIDKVYALPNLRRAWQQVKENNGAPGIDGMSVEQFGENLEGRLQHLSEDLHRKTYRAQAVRRVYIPKSGGGKRPLGIPTVRDRIVQQAMRQVLEPIFEAKFSSRSHGFRPERGCATALSVVDKAIRCGYQWVVDADIQAFFDTVDHEKLLAAVNEEIADGSLLRLIAQVLKAGVIEPEASEVEPTELGTPQGGPLSPLLANIYLHAFDRAIVQAGYGLVRYADDFVIFARSESEAQAAMGMAREVIEERLGLRLHPEKTRVVSVDAGFEFLGFRYFRDPKTGKRCKEVRAKSVRSFRNAIRERTPRLHTQRWVKPCHVTPGQLAKNKRLGAAIGRLNQYLRGWHWYFKAAELQYEPPFGSFDGFVRRRVRASVTGRVGSGWWNQRITNAVLRHLGLLSLTELQEKYQQGQLDAPARKG